MLTYDAYDDDPGGMFELIRNMEQSGYAMAQATVDYYRKKNEAALDMKAAKMPVTLIEAVLKGEPEVADALLQKMCREVEYRADMERVMARKANVKNINDQMNREYHS